MKSSWIAAGIVLALMGLGGIFVWSKPLREFHSISSWLDQVPERRQILDVPLVPLPPFEPTSKTEEIAIRLHGVSFVTPDPPQAMSERWEGFAVLTLGNVTVTCEAIEGKGFSRLLTGYGVSPDDVSDVGAIGSWLTELYSTRGLTQAEYLELSADDRESWRKRARLKSATARALRGASVVEGAEHCVLLLRGYHMETIEARTFVRDEPSSEVLVLLEGRVIAFLVMGKKWSEVEQVAERIAETVRPI